MKDTNSRTMTVSLKVTPYERMRFYAIAKSHNITFSEWAATLLDLYKNAYGALKINSYREDELLNEIDHLKKEINFLKAHNNVLKTQIDSTKVGLRF
jgi:hypothetical protein